MLHYAFIAFHSGEPLWLLASVLFYLKPVLPLLGLTTVLVFSVYLIISTGQICSSVPVNSTSDTWCCSTQCLWISSFPTRQKRSQNNTGAYYSTIFILVNDVGCGSLQKCRRVREGSVIKRSLITFMGIIHLSNFGCKMRRSFLKVWNEGKLTLGLIFGYDINHAVNITD